MIDSVKRLFLSQFSCITASYLEDLIGDVTSNKSSLYKHFLFVAEKKGEVIGAAIASQLLKENFLYVDYMASSRHKPSRGIGAALYKRIKEQSLHNQCLGVFLECDSIEREYCISDEEQRQNKIRLKFYQRFGAQQLKNSQYEKPRAKKFSMHLLFDNNQKEDLKLNKLKKVVRAILQSHNNPKCADSYIEEVVQSLDQSSFTPINKSDLTEKRAQEVRAHEYLSDQIIPFTMNPDHKVHHVKDKGYVESPIRIDSILKEIKKLSFFKLNKIKRFKDFWITEVHDEDYYKFLKRICMQAGQKTIYPDVFPIRNRAKIPKNLEDQAGYYCMDTYSPLNANAFIASRMAVNCALTAASFLMEGDHLSYALIRPPGHHAERRILGGFCYLNSTAISANFLSKQGRVAILDLDFHHGNGQQDIFYQRDDVLTISIHGHPQYAYPHFSGFKDETGHKKGRGFNINYPLPSSTTGSQYQKTLRLALEKITEFNPAYCVLALGLDTAKGDPTGSWKFIAKDFIENGRLVGSLKRPTLVVQEGGYDTQVLGKNAKSFFEGLMTGYYKT